MKSTNAHGGRNILPRCKVSRWEFSNEKCEAVLNRTGTAPVAIHGNVRLSRTSCSLHPDVQHFSRKYHHLPTNIFGRTFRPSWAFCVLESFQKTVAPAGYKNKQCRKQTSVLSEGTSLAYVPLRSATERERAAFLIPCQGLRGYFTNFPVTKFYSQSSIRLLELSTLLPWMASPSSTIAPFAVLRMSSSVWDRPLPS